MYAKNFYIPPLNQSSGTYVYYGENDPNTIDNWTRTPEYGDQYIQFNNSLLQPIKWLFTDNNSNGTWIVDSTIRFFIHTPNGTIVSPSQSVVAKAAYEIGGAITIIDELSDYNFLKLKHGEQDLSYELSVSFSDVSNKYLIQLINTRNFDILDVIEITPLSVEFDNIPPDNTSIQWFGHN